MISIVILPLNIEWAEGANPLSFRYISYFYLTSDVSIIIEHFYPVNMNPVIQDIAVPVLSTALHEV